MLPVEKSVLSVPLAHGDIVVMEGSTRCGCLRILPRKATGRARGQLWNPPQVFDSLQIEKFLGYLPNKFHQKD